jgi:hypothetical protein
MAYQHFNKLLCLGAFGWHVFQRVITAAFTAYIRFLARIHFGIGEESVLEIVNAGFNRFGISDRTQVPGDSQAPFVRLFDCGTHFFTGNVRVGLE